MANEHAHTDSVRQIHNQRSAPISDELNKILNIMREATPKNSIISFDFDGKLHVHVDVRDLEEVMMIEAILPKLGIGLFQDIKRGMTPHQAFRHRVSALVDR